MMELRPALELSGTLGPAWIGALADYLRVRSSLAVFLVVKRPATSPFAMSEPVKRARCS
jgi:hypothetical protein